MQAIQTGPSVWAGARRFGSSARAVSEDAIRRFALLAGVVLAQIVAPLWGPTLALSSLSRARKRLQSEGLVALGEFLVPEVSRQQYAEGVWRGLWRVHGVTLGFSLVQLPLVVVAFVPTALTAGLLFPLRFVFPFTVGAEIATVATAIVGFFCLVVVMAQSVLAMRLLAEGGSKLSLGYIARVSGEAWRATLRDLSTVLGIGVAVVGALIGAAILMAVTYLLASALKLAGGVSLVGLWTGVAVALFLFAAVLDAVVAWADGAKTGTIDAKAFSFSAWLRAWFGSMHSWFAAKGLVTVGIAVCLVAGVLTALVAILTDRNFTSWVGLGWFAVTAAVLVALSFKRGGKS